MNSSHNYKSIKPLYYSTQIIWYFLGVLQVVLAFRFILKLTGANPEAGFTSFVYTVSQPFIDPFSAVFSTSTVEGSVFEWTTLLAMFVYSLIAAAIVQLILLLGRNVSNGESIE